MYDYMQAMSEDVLEYIKDEINLSDWEGRYGALKDHLNDELWVVDSVTWNGSGSYTFNSARAKEYVLDGGADYLREACSEFGVDSCEIAERFLNEDWEWMDVTIRCYLLYRVIDEVVDMLAEEGDDE